jgi:hypothetical protein
MPLCRHERPIDQLSIDPQIFDGATNRAVAHNSLEVMQIAAELDESSLRK